MERRGPTLFGWVCRGLLLLLILSAPIVTYRAFTDDETPDPLREQRLREAKQRGSRPTPAVETPNP